MSTNQKDDLKENDVQSQQDESNNVQEDKLVLEQKQQILNNSGVLAAYEYFLRKLCKEGFPSGNIFEYAAQQVLKYEKKKQAEQFRQQTMKKSLAELQLNEKLKVQYGIKQDGKEQSPNKKGASPSKGGKKPDEKGKKDIQETKQKKK